MVINSMAVTIQLCLLLFLCFLVKQYRGVRSFTLGRAIGVLGYSFVFSRLNPLSIMIGIGSCLLLLSNSVCCLGIARFTGTTIRLRYVIIYNISFICIQFFLIAFYDRFIYKTIALTIFQSILMFAQFYFLFRNSKAGFVESSRFLMSVYLGMGIILILRMVALIRNPPPNFFAPSEANAASLLILFIYTSLLTIGFTMMVCQRLYADLCFTADTDELTRLLNRRAMMRFLNQEMSRYIRNGQTFGLILIDVDHFKSINDRYGHDGGDLVLVHLSHLLQTQSRKNDFVSRWGGEEFLILLPHITLKETFDRAEQLRIYIENNPTSSDIKITISSGVVVTTSYRDSVESLITAADHALYAAKRSGRNQVQLADISLDASPDLKESGTLALSETTNA